MTRKIRSYSGVSTPEVSQREIDNRKVVRQAAAEGAVLMKNNGILPIAKSAKVLLAGSGAVVPIKGGTGSGDTNAREIVDIYTGLKNAGLEVVNGDSVEEALADYADKMVAYVAKVKELLSPENADSGMNFFEIIEGNVPHDYKRPSIAEDLVAQADAVVYVISRTSGEGFDRHPVEGNYYLDAAEKAELDALKALTDKIVVLINAGGQIDLKGIYDNDQVAAILNISQGGMEMGNSVADLLTGKVTPSGKLTSTWAVNYEDFPSASTFSYMNGNTNEEYYTDSIYVGYRYFDSFGVDVVYPFGYGLSYTKFAFSEKKVSVKGNEVTVKLRVTNIGDKYAGKEVVQVYAACPQTELKKEYKRLVGFTKTGLIAPGKSQEVEVKIPAKAFASFDEAIGAWVIEAGQYGIFASNSSKTSSVAGVLQVESTVVFEELKHIMPVTEQLDEIVRPDAEIEKLTALWQADAQAAGLAPIAYAPVPEDKAEIEYTDLDEKAEEIAAKLTDAELTALLMGEITKGQDNLKDNELVKTGIFVPGAAGETTCILEEKYDVPAVSMADGPAGLRLLPTYEVDKDTGCIYSKSILASLSGGLFADNTPHEGADTYYQYATAIPIGTCLAQTFDTELIKTVGQMVGQEMVEFGVSWWLAPGMNIHRNPLCGRNFEYYSEDPLVAGTMAAAMTMGVQTVPGVGTTIKHFACNNQEENRMGVDSIVSERALREIYLRGFEIAVKTAQPMCIMTSYNMINGIHSANSYDLCTVAAREEWGFKGVIMTDWTTTIAGDRPASPHVCALAGNDLIMPGCQSDVEDIMASLRNGALPRETARACAARLIKVIFQTLGMENPLPYGKY